MKLSFFQKRAKIISLHESWWHSSCHHFLCYYSFSNRPLSSTYHTLLIVSTYLPIFTVTWNIKKLTHFLKEEIEFYLSLHLQFLAHIQHILGNSVYFHWMDNFSLLNILYSIKERYMESSMIYSWWTDPGSLGSGLFHLCSQPKISIFNSGQMYQY